MLKTYCLKLMIPIGLLQSKETFYAGSDININTPASKSQLLKNLRKAQEK